MSSGNYQVFIPMSQTSTDGLPRTNPKDPKTSTEGAVLSFHNICYRVKVQSGFLLNRKTVEKEILINVKYVHERLFKQLYWQQWTSLVLPNASTGAMDILFVYMSVQIHRYTFIPLGSTGSKMVGSHVRYKLNFQKNGQTVFKVVIPCASTFVWETE